MMMFMHPYSNISYKRNVMIANKNKGWTYINDISNLAELFFKNIESWRQNDLNIL